MTSSRSSNEISRRETSGPRAAPALNIAVFAAGFMTFINMWCTQAILPQLAAGLHVAQAATGLTVTAPLLATALMAPITGAISDRFGRRKLILAAAFCVTLPTLAAGLATSFDMLVAARFAEGLLLPFVFTVTIAFIGDETKGPATVRLAGTYNAGAIFGGFSGRIVSGLMTQADGWRSGMLVIAALTLVSAAALAFTLPPERNFNPVYGVRNALKSFPQHLANPKLLSIFAVGFGVLFCLVATFTYINFRLAAAPYNLGPAALGAIFVVYLGGVAMSPIAARLANRFGRRNVMAAIAPITIAGLLLTLATPLPLIALGLLLICSTVFMQQTIATGAISTATQTAKSTAVGLYITCYYIGGSAGGLAPAPLFHAYAWPGCTALIIAAQLLMLATVARWWR